MDILNVHVVGGNIKYGILTPEYGVSAIRYALMVEVTITPSLVVVGRSITTVGNWTHTSIKIRR